MNTIIRFAAVAIVLASVTARGQDKVSPDFIKIGELNEAYVVAFNARDEKKVTALFTGAADFTILTGDMLRGRDQIAAGHRSFFENNPQAKISGQQLSRRFISPNVVLATGKWKVKNGPQQFPSSGTWSTVVVKKEGKWKYEAMRLSVPAKPSP